MIFQQQPTLAPIRFTLRTWAIALGFAILAALLVRVALIEPLYAGAAIYVLAFVTLSWRRPDLALMVIFASATVAADVSQGAFAKFSMAEANLVLALPAFYFHCIVRKRVASNGPIAIPVALYFGVCLFSSYNHWLGQDALISLLQMFIYLVLVVAMFANFAQSDSHLLRCLFAIVVSGTGVAIGSLVTNFHFLGENKNGLGDLIASTLQVTVILFLATETHNKRRKYWLMGAMGILTVGLVMSLSRGSWLGTLCGLLVIFGLRREFKKFLILILVLAPIVAICWFSLPQDLQEYSTGFGKDRYNINARYESVDLAQRYFVKSPVYGMGVGLRKEYDATNIALMVLAETGVLGLVTFLLIHAAFFRMVWVTQKKLSVSDPIHPLLCVGAALVLARLMHGMVDHYWTRGVLMTAWAAAGMTTAAYLAVRRRDDSRALEIP
jgi:O-antigen ligase